MPVAPAPVEPSPSPPATAPPVQAVGAPNLGHPADEAPYWKICGGQVVGIVWFKILTPAPAPSPPVPRPTPGGPSVQALYSLAASVVAPPIAVGFDPAGFGITGAPSYFWVTGYDGSPIHSTVRGTDPVTGRQATIELRATLSDFAWRFGDGAALTTTSPGRPYPAVSDISHVYDVRSDRSPQAVNGAYPVRVSAVFDVAYRVVAPGLPPAGWTPFSAAGLPPITSTAEHDHKVIEVRSILSGASPSG